MKSTASEESPYRRKFEIAFIQTVGHTPVQMINSKIGAGTKIRDIQYYYNIIAAEASKKANCPIPDFSVFYEEYKASTARKLLSKGENIMLKQKKLHNKLVRDKIPEIIRADGRGCLCETLSPEMYLRFLDEKLNEELAEYQESKSLEELADLLEVMGAVVKARGYTWEQLTTLRKEKREKRGGFEKRILLKEVYEPE